MNYCRYLILVLLMSCHYDDTRLIITNKSSNGIIVSCKTKILDSLLIALRDSIPVGKARVISIPSGPSQNEWSNKIRKSKDKTLKICVFNLDFIHEKMPTRVRAFYIPKNKIIDTLVFTETQLDSMKWQVNYYGDKK